MKGLTATQRLLEAAAAPTIQRIKEDRRHAPPQVRPLLDYLEEHLFEPELDASRLKRACGIRDNAVPIHFHNALKLPPYAYIEDCRMQTGSQLLLDTSLRIWQIAQLLGYSNLQVFSRAFQRWAGMRPTAFRSRAEAQRPVGPAAHGQRSCRAQELVPSPVTEAAPIPMELLRRALHGGLDKVEAVGLFRRLAEIYPSSFQEIVADGGRGAGRREFEPGRWPTVSLDEYRGVEAVERIKAEEVWNELRDQAEDEQLRLVRLGARFRTAALFEHLRKKSVEEGRKSRAHGVRIARLAIESAATVVNDEDFCKNLRARAWANLSNALRLNDDFQEAEAAIRRAESHLPQQPDPLAEAEVIHLKASLHWSQRQVSDALVLEWRAIALFRRVGNKDWLVRALIMQALILDYDGRALEGVPCLTEAITLADEMEDPYLKYSASHALLNCYTSAERYAAAATILPSVRELCEELRHPFVSIQLQWLEGLIAQGLGQLGQAEEYLVQTRSDCLQLGRMAHAGIVTLDLCLTLFQQGKTEEVLSLASEVVPLLEAFSYHDETVVALQLLKSAQESRLITLEKIQKIRSLAGGLLKDPRVK